MTQRPPTDRQEQVLAAIQKFAIEHDGNSPTIRELCALLEISSPNGIMCHLKALAKKGVLEPLPEDGKARGIRLTPAHSARHFVCGGTAVDLLQFSSASGVSAIEAASTAVGGKTYLLYRAGSRSKKDQLVLRDAKYEVVPHANVRGTDTVMGLFVGRVTVAP